jgi:hypothetical protein
MMFVAVFMFVCLCLLDHPHPSVGPTPHFFFLSRSRRAFSSADRISLLSTCYLLLPPPLPRFRVLSSFSCSFVISLLYLFLSSVFSYRCISSSSLSHFVFIRPSDIAALDVSSFTAASSAAFLFTMLRCHM